MANMISIGRKTKELLRHHCSYHGNLVNIATMPIVLRKLYAKNGLNRT